MKFWKQNTTFPSPVEVGGGGAVFLAVCLAVSDDVICPDVKPRRRQWIRVA